MFRFACHGDHLGPGQSGGVLRRRRRELNARLPPPVTHQSGQAGDQPDRVATSRRAVQAMVIRMAAGRYVPYHRGRVFDEVGRDARLHGGARGVIPSLSLRPSTPTVNFET